MGQPIAVFYGEFVLANYTIRRAAYADAQTLGHIGVATFVASYSHDIPGPAMMAHCSREHSADAYRAYLGDPATACWLAEHEGTHAPVGYAMNCAPDLPIDLQPGDLELKRIYVLTRFYGTGCGASLLDQAIAHARANKAPRLLLGTYEGNHRAMAFYEKHGFETIGTRKFDVGGKVFDDIIMAKGLHSPA